MIRRKIFQHFIFNLLPSSPLSLRDSWDFLEGKFWNEGGGGLGGGPPQGGGGREGGFLVLATMSGSTVKCRGGLRGPDVSKSTCLSITETWSKMSAGLWSCSPSGCFCPTVLVMSGGCTASCDGPDGPGDSAGSWAGKARAPFVAILSRCCSCSRNCGWTAGTADSTGTSWASSSSWWISLSTSAFTSTCSWSKSSAPSPALPFWLSSMMLSMIYRRAENNNSNKYNYEAIIWLPPRPESLNHKWYTTGWVPTAVCTTGSI